MRTKKSTMKRRTHIIMETERVLIIKDQAGTVRGWCEACEALARLATPEIAAALTGLSRRAVYRLIETGQIHFTESPDAAIAVCLESIIKSKPYLSASSLQIKIGESL